MGASVIRVGASLVAQQVFVLLCAHIRMAHQKICRMSFCVLFFPPLSLMLKGLLWLCLCHLYDDIHVFLDRNRKVILLNEHVPSR